jgi:hypothetical protein
LPDHWSSKIWRFVPHCGFEDIRIDDRNKTKIVTRVPIPIAEDEDGVFVEMREQPSQERQDPNALKPLTQQTKHGTGVRGMAQLGGRDHGESPTGLQKGCGMRKKRCPGARQAIESDTLFCGALLSAITQFTIEALISDERGVADNGIIQSEGSGMNAEEVGVP